MRPSESIVTKTILPRWRKPSRRCNTIKRTSGIPPELNEYLLEYPKAKSAKVQAGFYWEKVNFGLKPTFRIVPEGRVSRSKPIGPCLRISGEAALRKPLLRNGT
jgi:hypothetical protein